MKNYVTISLRNELQIDPENPIVVIIKDADVDVISCLVYVYLAVDIKDEEEIGKYLRRQFEIHKMLERILDSVDAERKGEDYPAIPYTFEVVEDGENSGSVRAASIVLDPGVFDVEIVSELEDDSEKVVL